MLIEFFPLNEASPSNQDTLIFPKVSRIERFLCTAMIRIIIVDKYHGTLELPGGEAEMMDPADERNIGGVEPIHDGKY